MALTETFLDNQTIGGEDLNNIAIDLGNPTFANFDDGSTYNIDNLNGITASLVTKGILQDANKMMPTLSNNNVIINTGICVFESGAKKRITAPQSIQIQPNITQYIYLNHNSALNKIELVADETSPQESGCTDYVNLATYNVNGTLTDTRLFSKSKANLPTEPIPVILVDRLSGNSSFTRSFDTGLNDFTYVMYTTTNHASTGPVRLIKPLADGASITLYNEDSYNVGITATRNGAIVTFSSSGITNRTIYDVGVI